MRPTLKRATVAAKPAFYVSYMLGRLNPQNVCQKIQNFAAIPTVAAKVRVLHKLKKAMQTSVERGSPYDAWTRQTAAALGLQATLCPPGNPKRQVVF